MPPRPPPSPFVLTLLNSLAVAVATWLCVATDALTRGLVATLFGIPFGGVAISAATRYLPAGDAVPAGRVGAGAYALIQLAAVPAMILVAWLAFRIARGFHTAGFVRGLGLAWLTVALLWLPAALVAAALPGGTGPVHELYLRLGAPMAGRWTAAALGMVLLVLAGGVLSGAAVDVGRFWMRVDSREFRRRLVQAAEGWPAAVSLVLLAWGVGWAPTPWVLPFVLAAPAVLHFQTD